MNRVYPAPAIVLGVGRFGLAVCERMGEEWLGLQLSGADRSIANLRLLALGAAGEELEPQAGGWEDDEPSAALVARFLGADGDLPVRALNLAILRTLGLVRYRDGFYQVAIPRDDGAAEAELPTEDGSRRVIYRRRHFEWLSLSQDPLIAAERLHHQTERVKELDLFVTPLLNRVRQGHSPDTLIAAIGRCGALLSGRDPSPWRWVIERSSGEEDLDLLPHLPPPHRCQALLGAYWRHLDHDPLPGWRERFPVDVPDRDTEARPPGDPPPLFVRLPASSIPDSSDLPSPLDPLDLLRQDWESTGWASGEASRSKSTGESAFRIGPQDDFPSDATGPVPRELRCLAAIRLGLFDHQEPSLAEEVRDRTATVAELLPARLHTLGEQVYRGLVRLWVDLQRSRIDELDVPVMVQARHRDHLDDSLRQSLEILGELLVRPLVGTDRSSLEGDHSAGSEAEPRPPGAAEQVFRDRPTRFLRSLAIEIDPDGSSPGTALARRLADLGLASTDEQERLRQPLFEYLELHRPDPASGVEPGGLQKLRQTLNRQVRELFAHRFLTAYRQRPTRQPPRLTLFVIADMSETFARATVRTVLREIHRELPRAFTPIFQTYRQGFDRSLAVTPILWTPHPADPYMGAEPGRTRPEEAAIIDAIHGVRRWVESVLPPGRRFVSQIFLNSRVTDTAALSLEDALCQTHDFLTFQMRNDLSADRWLRATATGSGGSDLFSSFACHSIEFPALRCREYLANRLARESLRALLDGPQTDPQIPDLFQPPAVDDLVEAAREHLGQVTERAGEELASRISSTLSVDETTDPREIERRFDHRFETEILQLIQVRWHLLTGKAGRVDELVDQLRLETVGHLRRRLDQLQQATDELVTSHACVGGMKTVEAGLQMLRSTARDHLDESEARRRASEAVAERHTVPRLDAVGAGRRRILEAARAKPERPPLRLGLAVCLFLAAALGAPIAHTIALAFDLDLDPGLLELVLGPFGGLTVAVLATLSTKTLVKRHLAQRTETIRNAISELATSVRRLIAGAGGRPEHEGSPSVRSFLESRLELTGSVAVCGFSLSLHERTTADAHLGDRLRRSLDIQDRLLRQRAEDLGVRPGGDGGDDLHALLDDLGTGNGHLIGPDDLELYYRRDFGQPEDLAALLPEVVEAAGGFDGWRRHASLADSERLLSRCRELFEKLVEHPVSDQHFFADSVGERLLEFVARSYPNLGFGAEFKGYEGLDPDGVQVLADASLVVHPELALVFERARKLAAGKIPTTATMRVQEVAIRPNAAYMLSLVQGVRVHSLRNIQRFETFHDRVHLPDDRAFPLSHEVPRRRDSSGQPINAVTGYEEIGRRLARSLSAPSATPDRTVAHGRDESEARPGDHGEEAR